MKDRLFSLLRPVGNVLAAFSQRYSTLNCQLMAAGISFYALLSLMPLLLVAVAVLSYVLRSSDQAVGWMTHVLSEYFPSVSDPSGHRMVDALAVRHDQLATGGVGLALLVWSGMRLFDTVERALTTIWTGGEQRSFLRRQLVGLLTMWGAGGVVLLSIGASLLLAFVQQSSFLNERFSPESWPFMWKALAAAPSFVIVAGATFLVYRLVPKTHVPWKAALVGAVPAALMWEALRQTFATFVSLSSHRWEIYGGLATAVLLTFWIYCSTSVLLFGALIARTYQERRLEKTTDSGLQTALKEQHDGHKEPEETVDAC